MCPSLPLGDLNEVMCLWLREVMCPWLRDLNEVMCPWLRDLNEVMCPWLRDLNEVMCPWLRDLNEVMCPWLRDLNEVMCPWLRDLNEVMCPWLRDLNEVMCPWLRDLNEVNETHNITTCTLEKLVPSTTVTQGSTIHVIMYQVPLSPKAQPYMSSCTKYHCRPRLHVIMYVPNLVSTLFSNSIKREST